MAISHRASLCSFLPDEGLNYLQGEINETVSDLYKNIALMELLNLEHFKAEYFNLKIVF